MITTRNDFGHDIEDYDQPFSDPIELLMMWLPPHIDEFRPLMSLATIDENGYPDLRHVLLSSYDQRGITFHVDADSRKVKQLALCAKAAATIGKTAHHSRRCRTNLRTGSTGSIFATQPLFAIVGMDQ